MKEQKTVEVLEEEVKNFKDADEVREFPKSRLELVKIGGLIVGRARLEPGWTWEQEVQPTMKTDSCEGAHLMYFISGVMGIRMDDGNEFECRAGDVCLVPPGHKTWVIGDEAVEVVDFQGMDIFSESKQ